MRRESRVGGGKRYGPLERADVVGARSALLARLAEFEKRADADLAAVLRQALAGCLDAYAARAVKEWKAPGLAIAVVKNDSVVFARGYGVREIGKAGAVDARTLFAIGSSSKAFTVAALGMLVDEGKVSWDDVATKYLPDLQLFDPYVTRELTVRDLVTHRSGLTRGDRVIVTGATLLADGDAVRVIPGN